MNAAWTSSHCRPQWVEVVEVVWAYVDSYILSVSQASASSSGPGLQRDRLQQKQCGLKTKTRGSKPLTPEP